VAQRQGDGFLTELLWHFPTTAGALLFLLGCCVGSFISVIVYRLPLMRAHQEQNSRFNLALPSSSCPHCGSAIKPQHNLPVGSYLWLRGRSACCSERISKRYLVTEIATGLLGVLVYLWLLSQQPDAHELAAGLLPSLLLVWWLVAITAMLWHSSKDTQALWQSLLWLGLIANLQLTTPALNEAILAVCTVYVSALLATTIQALMQRRNGSSAEQVSYLALGPSWHGLAALVAWFSWPGAEALSLGAATGAIVAAFECRFAPKIGGAEVTGGWKPRAVQHGIAFAFSAAWLKAFTAG
jgi:prepilin signal peptidase PulO-like enzyme (type II secretory pathway)